MPQSENSKDTKRSDLDRWRSRYHVRILFWMTVLSVLASVAGVVYAVNWGKASDGQLGGAIGVAIAFVCLFAAKPTAAHILDGRPGETPFEKQPVERQVLKLRNSLAVTMDVQRLERVYVSIASIQGTLFWAFGDKIARFFGAPLL